MKGERPKRKFRQSFVNEMSEIHAWYNMDASFPCAWVKTRSEYACDVDIKAAAPSELTELIEFLTKLRDDMYDHFPWKD